MTSKEPQKIRPGVSVIVPCRNERDHIEACLRSILGQRPPPDGFEVIVADGMSDDGTRQILESMARRYPSLRLIDNAQGIVSTGLNGAIRSARGKIIVRMDVHTEYAPDYLAQCVSALNESQADNVGGPARTRAEGFMQAAVSAAYHSFFSVGGARFHDVEYEGYVDTVTYGCWRRETFDRIGFFDEELVRNQDDEFNLRLIRSGGKIWQSPRIKSWYKPRATVVSLFRQYAQYGYWKVRVIQKHRMPASLRHLVPGCFVLSLWVLPLTWFFWSWVLWVWGAIVMVYALTNVLASAAAAAQKDWKLFWVLPVVFGCFHFGYGIGFLRGLWDFVLLRRDPASSYRRLTRPAIR